jgi:hypothetical protein
MSLVSDLILSHIIIYVHLTLTTELDNMDVDVMKEDCMGIDYNL